MPRRCVRLLYGRLISSRDCERYGRLLGHVGERCARGSAGSTRVVKQTKAKQASKHLLHHADSQTRPPSFFFVILSRRGFVRAPCHPSPSLSMLSVLRRESLIYLGGGGLKQERQKLAPLYNISGSGGGGVGSSGSVHSHALSSPDASAFASIGLPSPSPSALSILAGSSDGAAMELDVLDTGDSNPSRAAALAAASSSADAGAVTGGGSASGVSDGGATAAYLEDR